MIFRYYFYSALWLLLSTYCDCVGLLNSETALGPLASIANGTVDSLSLPPAAPVGAQPYIPTARGSGLVACCLLSLCSCVREGKVTLDSLRSCFSFSESASPFSDFHVCHSLLGT